ncbi:MULTISPECIES: hypothetical protein [unclassified Mesorhizobium]|uniref:hypothetical protein n=1 Tax=unclassified Mesorhizobium TaxID=325217 RepID=UPI002417642C|nr:MULTISPECIES: hypothetical protein [unclassified Mesorhizobium]WFP61616.1 hypothetical protein QAZ47_24525 [Mesorhizobium sp. WSM4904]WFP74906.1 hypothetical protein QAZ22_24710 [Mesorhizobium sp. WSM4906]
MKKLLLASMIAIASAFAIAPASAASVEFGIGVGPGYDYGDYYDGYYPHRYYRTVYDDDYYAPSDRYVARYHHRYYRDNCRVEYVRHWRHHHRVIERVRVCD